MKHSGTHLPGARPDGLSEECRGRSEADAGIEKPWSDCWPDLSRSQDDPAGISAQRRLNAGERALFEVGLLFAAVLGIAVVIGIALPVQG